MLLAEWPLGPEAFTLKKISVQKKKRVLNYMYPKHSYIFRMVVSLDTKIPRLHCISS
jgi:hypothetical protein